MVKYRDVWDRGEPNAPEGNQDEKAVEGEEKPATPSQPRAIRMTAINAAEALKRGGGRYTLHEPKPKKAVAEDEDDDPRDKRKSVTGNLVPDNRVYGHDDDDAASHRAGGPVTRTIEPQKAKTVEAKNQPKLR